MKRSWILTFFAIVVFAWSIYSYTSSRNVEDDSSRSVYIDNCILELKDLPYSENEKLNACSCRHEFLFNKYGDDIYAADFIIPTSRDSLKVIECLLNIQRYDNLDLSSDTLLELLEKKKQGEKDNVP